MKVGGYRIIWCITTTNRHCTAKLEAYGTALTGDEGRSEAVQCSQHSRQLHDEAGKRTSLQDWRMNTWERLDFVKLERKNGNQFRKRLSVLLLCCVDISSLPHPRLVFLDFLDASTRLQLFRRAASLRRNP
jgi:hypothetical protein